MEASFRQSPRSIASGSFRAQYERGFVTENLVDAVGEETPVESLQTLVCGDPTALFSLLRAGPVEYLTGIPSASSLHETNPFTEGVGMTQNRWPFSWKDFLVGDEHIQNIYKSDVVPSWDVDGISQVVMSISLEMFQDEESA